MHHQSHADVRNKCENGPEILNLESIELTKSTRCRLITYYEKKSLHDYIYKNNLQDHKWDLLCIFHMIS